MNNPTMPMLSLNRYAILLLFIFTTWISAIAQVAPMDDFIAQPVKNVEQTFPELATHFRGYSVHRLDMSTVHQQASRQKGEFNFTLKAGQHDWDLTLEKNDLRAADYRLRIGTEDGVEEGTPGPVTTYKGYLGNDPTQQVRLSIREDGISGMVMENGTEYFIEPADRFTSQAGQEEVVVYRSQDVVGEALSCAVEKRKGTHSNSEGKASGSVEPRSSGCQLTEIAIAAANDMVTSQGSVNNVETEVTEILNIVSALYEPAPLEIEYEITEIFVSTNASGDITDPSAVETDTILYDFTDWCIAGGFSSSYDVASFWVDRDVEANGNTGVAGKAWIGVICEEVTNAQQPFGKYNILEHAFSSQAGNRTIQAHELGHNWDQGAHVTGDADYIMSATITTTSDKWHSGTLTKIQDHRDTRTCLGSCPVAVEEQQGAEGGFRVYPNPAREILTVEAPLVSSAQQTRVRITNVLGSVVLEGELLSGTTTNLDVSVLERGVYFLSVNTGEDRTIRRFVKE